MPVILRNPRDNKLLGPCVLSTLAKIRDPAIAFWLTIGNHSDAMDTVAPMDADSEWSDLRVSSGAFARDSNRMSAFFFGISAFFLLSWMVFMC